MWGAIWRLLMSPFVKWLATAIVAVAGIYGTFFYERKAEITFEIVSSANVLDIRESLNKLAIVYDGTDLRATNQNLHLLVIRIVNRGTSGVLKSDFDEAEPLGFRVNTGKIVDLPVVIADSYLSNNLKPLVSKERTVTFSPVIINAGDSFLVRTLLLIPENAALSVTPLGKIAGINKIAVITTLPDHTKSSFWQEAFSAPIAVQAGRTVGYFFIFIAFAAVVGFGIGVPISAISEKISKSGRRKQVAKYREAVGRRLTLKEEYLASQYIEGTAVFTAFARILRPRDPEFVYVEPHMIEMQITENGARPIVKQFKREYDELAENELIIRDGPQTDVAPDFIQPAREFLNFVSPVHARGQQLRSKGTTE